MSSAEKRVEIAINTIRQGKMVIMIDDEDRENEGDLVYAAALSSPTLVNFMIKEARGLVCVTMDSPNAKRLELNPMVSRNNESYETAFTVSVDAATASTGISAYERDDTIKLLADPLSKPNDLVRPGHIFPLIAKDGGVLVRTGHTEGASDLCRLAGLAPVGVICEIVKDDGTMARRDDLDIFAKEHDLPIVYIADLIEYRLQRESLVTLTSSEKSSFFDSEVVIEKWQDHLNRVHQVVVFGHVSDQAAVKFHTIGKDIDLLTNSRQFGGLIGAIDHLKAHGGLLIFVDDTKENTNSFKEFGIGAQILSQKGIKKITLLATKEIKNPVAISGFGLEIEKEIIL